MPFGLHPRFTSYEFWREHEAYGPAPHGAVSALTRQILGQIARYAPLAGCELVETRYIMFVLWGGPLMRVVERALRHVPLGAQYLVVGRRRGTVS